MTLRSPWNLCGVVDDAMQQQRQIRHQAEHGVPLFSWARGLAVRGRVFIFFGPAPRQPGARLAVERICAR